MISRFDFTTWRSTSNPNFGPSLQRAYCGAIVKRNRSCSGNDSAYA